MQYGIGNFHEDTRVQADPRQPGRYLGNIPPSWNILYSFGGVTMATAVSAARAALSQPEFELLTTTATFVSPISAGPITLDVKPLRIGKGAEQLVVDARGGEPDAGQQSDLHVVCTFAPQRESETNFVDIAFPDVPLPDQVERRTPPPGLNLTRLPYHHCVETRMVRGDLPWARDWEAGPAQWAAWHRLRVNPRLPDGTLDPLAYVPAVDMIGPAVRQAQGAQAPITMAISLEICLHFFARTDSEWLLQDVQACHAGGGYASGRVNLWDERGQLVAQGTQRAMLRSLPAFLPR